MSNVILWLRENKKVVTFAKLIIMSLLALLSIKWMSLINVLLCVALVFVLTEFDFDGLYICFFLATFRFIFRFELTGSIPYVSIVFGVYAVFTVIKYWLIKKEKPKFNWWIIGLSVAFLGYLLLPVYDFIFSEYFKFVFMIVAINYLFLFRDKIKIKQLVLYFVYGCIAASFIFLFTQIMFASYFKELYWSVGTTFNVRRFSGLSGDPNYYSLDLLIALSGLYYLYFKKEIKTTEYYIMLSILSCFVWLTYSKSMLLGILCIAIFIFISSLVKDAKNSWKKPLFFIVTVVAALFVTHFIFRAKTLYIFSRFEDKYTASSSLADNILTGRWTLWMNHIKFIFSSFRNFMFGGGIGTIVEPMECHNTYIQILYETGFIGTVLFLSIIGFILFKSGFKLKFFNPKNWINWIVLVGFAFMLININYFGATSFVFHIAIALLVLLKENQTPEKEVKSDHSVDAGIQQSQNVK